MSKIDTSIQRNEDEFPNFDVSDDVLEGSACVEAPLVEYTHYGCTYYGYCPGY